MKVARPTLQSPHNNHLRAIAKPNAKAEVKVAKTEEEECTER